MPVRGFVLGVAMAVALAAATPAFAVTELQWWHAMTGSNNDVIVKLANDFNASQSDYKVIPTYKGSYPDTMNAGIAAFRAGNAPHIMQVFEVGTATMMAATGAVKPVHVLMKEASETLCQAESCSIFTQVTQLLAKPQVAEPDALSFLAASNTSGQVFGGVSGSRPAFLKASRLIHITIEDELNGNDSISPFEVE